MIKNILNHNDDDTGMFHGHPTSGWMHFKDVITSVMRRVKNRHLHPGMHDLEKMWRYIIAMKPQNESATEEVLVLRKDLTSVDFTNLQLSKEGCIDAERALPFPPMGMRSVYKYQACVAPDKQNMQMMQKFVTPYYYVKVEADSTGINRIYKDGIRAGVDGIQGKIGIRVGWHSDDEYLSVINGGLSFRHNRLGRKIKADSQNPLEQMIKARGSCWMSTHAIR